jgi:tetratricopeptide (TPR) repeat protein
LALIAANVIVYAPVRSFAFVDWDDPAYVAENVYVARGLTWQGARWALTSTDAANWHPLTWLSHMLDVQLYGMNAGPQHVTNLVFHIFNTLLLFGLLYWMTGALGRSTFVAGLFAVHPLHVESVAWISERKDVLSALFWMLTILAYVAYVRRPRLRRYFLVLLLFGAGLMAKPMLVTLPFVLLLLDFWPLRRVELEGGAGRRGLDALRQRRPEALRLVREKIPLFALAAISSVVTDLVQKHGGAVDTLVPLSIRLSNAAASYLAYIGKMLWPVRLAAFYPLAPSMPVFEASLGVLLLIGVTIFAVRAGQRHGYFLVGWLWYVGTLVPVIGLVQVGDQSMADRYTYVPLIGLFLVAAWGAPELAARWRRGKSALPVAAACILLACGALARAQALHWSDSIALWQHAVDVTEDNYLAQNNLGIAFTKQGRDDDAFPHYAEALRLRPTLARADNSLGLILSRKGELDQAAQRFAEALRIAPYWAEAHGNLGNALAGQGKVDEAIAQYKEALRLDPGFAEAHTNLGAALAGQGRFDEAIGQYTEALRLAPRSAEAHNNLAIALAGQGRFDEAIGQYTEALRLVPDSAEVHNNLGNALIGQGRVNEAIEEYTEALRLKPDLVTASNNLKFALAKQGRNQPK